MKFKAALLMALGLATMGSLPVFAGPDTTDAKAQPPQVQPPAENPLGFTLSVGYDTDYIFRGTEFAKNLISTSLDYTTPLNNIFSIDLNAWYGASADDSAAPFAGSGSYGELDLSGSVLAKLGPVTAGVKYTYYDYLANARKFVEDINEVGLTLSTSVVGFDVGANGFYDATARGFYFEYWVSRTFPVTDWLSLVPGFLISNATHYYGVNGGNNIKLSLSAPIKLTKSATLTPYVAGNLPFDSLKDNGEKNRVYGGVALSVSF